MDNIRPESWASGFELPDKSVEDEQEVYDMLFTSLFHMTDVEAEKIKNQYIQKYPFIDREIIKGW